MNASGYGEFELDLSDAIRRDLPGFVKSVPLAPLSKMSIDLLPETQGVYALYINDEIVYVGKTSAEEGFSQRVGRHREHVQHRLGLDPSKIMFRAVRIMVFNMFDVEKIMIEEAGGKDKNRTRALWNNSGFGGNDPGIKRDTQEVADFDLWYPILVNIELEFIKPGEYPLKTILSKVRKHLPYTFRYEKSLKHNDQTVVLRKNIKWTMQEFLEYVVEFLGHSWQATVLHGRVVMYEERKNYSDAQLIIRSEPNPVNQNRHHAVYL